MRRAADAEFVCGECFSDEGLQNFCTSYAERNECDFCGAKSSEPIAAPLDDVIDHIRSCVHEHYDDPANAGLPYESAEGGYQGTLYSTDEVFMELGLDFPRDKDDRLREAIENGMENVLWSDADPFALSRGEQLQFSWEQFCRVIKHERRYFFLQPRKKASNWHDHDELFGPAEILETIFRFAEDAGAFVRLPAGARVFRARHQPPGKTYCSAGQLGPPPIAHATQTNRMSPPGVVMMYASEDRDTALAETAAEPGTFVVGEFAIERELLILDLSRLPKVPSFFAEIPDSFEYDPRPRISFLHSVSSEISRPIARDDRVHVEYVPTQVVTEYVRTSVRINGRRVDGIRYKSSRRHTETALVLFADQDNLILETPERPEFYRKDDRWVRLVRAVAIRVTAKDIARWAARPRVDLFEEA
jgi:hypothetical protein